MEPTSAPLMKTRSAGTVVRWPQEVRMKMAMAMMAMAAMEATRRGKGAWNMWRGRSVGSMARGAGMANAGASWAGVGGGVRDVDRDGRNPYGRQKFGHGY